MRFIPALIAAASLAFAAPVFAHGFRLGDLEIGHPYIAEPPATAKSAGGYLKVTNGGTTPDRLIAVEGALAQRIELHTSETDAAGVTKMRHLGDGIEIPAGATVVLERGGQHVMLMGLTAPLVVGEKYPATLVFEKAGRVDIEFSVDAATAAEPDHSGH